MHGLLNEANRSLLVWTLKKNMKLFWNLKILLFQHQSQQNIYNLSTISGLLATKSNNYFIEFKSYERVNTALIENKCAKNI